VYDVGSDGDSLFLAMQWIAGQDLKHVIDTTGRLVPDRAVRIATQLAGALDAVHAVGLLHRDVKPANVLVRQVGGADHVYLTDFGVAKQPENGEQLTQTGAVVGTVGYLSPEQIRGQDPEPRSDLYALGCLFFEMLTGRPPFGGDNEMALRWAHATDQRPLVSAAVPELGARYDRFVAIALAVDPAQRFGSGQEFADVLAAAHGAEDDKNRPMTAPVAVPRTPTTVGPPTPIPPAAMPPAGAPIHPAYGYVTPPPSALERSRSGSPLALVVLGLIALAGLAVGALAAAGVLSHSTVTAASAASRPTAPRPDNRQRNTRSRSGSRPTASRAANRQPNTHASRGGAGPRTTNTTSSSSSIETGASTPAASYSFLQATRTP
jgi:serine/threonine-protein kinase